LISEPENVLGKLNIDKQTKEDFIELLKIKMIPEPVKIRADFKLTCYKFQGIDAIRAALMEGEKLSTNDIQIKVK
jgi:translation initiation factor 2 subunit 1